MIAATRSPTQARGRLRRQILLAAARELLETHDLDALSLADVAAHAGVPKASAYHFYANVHQLYGDLSRVIAVELREDQFQPIETAVAGWQDVMAAAIERGAAFFNASTAARQLILGPKSPPEIKRSDRQADYELARSIQAQIGLRFILPELPGRDDLFFRAVEIADLMFCLSVLDHDRITDAMLDEARKAAVAYLGLYLPSILPPVSGGEAPD